MEVLLAGLDDAEMEALSTGPLRNLSISHVSFSSAHHQQQQAAAAAAALAQQQQQQPEGLQQGGAAAATAASPLNEGLPKLASIATSAAAVQPSEVSGVTADDAAIEQLVEQMLQHVCCDVMPGRIELGDSPTRSTSLTRRLAYEGAGPSRLGSKGAAAAAVADHSAAGTTRTAASAQGGTTAAQEAAAAPAAAVAAGSGSQQQQQEPVRAQAAADAHVVRIFMEAHCSQLTPYGLASLAECLKEHQLAVFFR